MQKSRRDFAKKTAMVVGATAVGATALAATNSSGSEELDSNGVVIGHSPKKEVLYKKSKAWEELYKQAL